MLDASPSALLGRVAPADVNQLTEQLRTSVRTGVYSPGEKLPTIRQLAEQTGLAHNVVSRAFSNLQSEGLLVSRKRAGTFVRNDYDPREATHSPTRLRVFGLVVPELSSAYYPLLHRGFDVASAELGYQIITSNTENDVRCQADAILRLMDKGSAGVALVPATQGASAAPHIRQLQNTGIPVVLLHRGIDGVSAPLLRIPAEDMGRLAAERLVAAGHVRIGFCSSQRAGVALQYERGFRLALEAAGVDLLDKNVYFANMTRIDGWGYDTCEQEVSAWMADRIKSPDRPTAVFTTFETIGEMVYLATLHEGLRLPDDLTIVTVGGRQRQGIVAQRLACVALDEDGAGRLAVKLLDEMAREKTSISNDQAHVIGIDFDPGGMMPVSPSDTAEAENQKFNPVQRIRGFR